MIKRRRTIGLIACDVIAEVDRAIWQGVAEGARKKHLNLVFFAGGALRDPVAHRQNRKMIYQHISVGRLDGLIIFSSSINFAVSRQEMIEFIHQFAELPVVSLEEIYPGIPSLAKDDAGGMRLILEHLIAQHGRRKIVYMQGPAGFAGTQKRFQAYQETLSTHQIPFDPNLVTMFPETWFYDEAVRNFELFLDEHALEPRFDFDAVAAVNDESALAAIHVMRKRGIRVPGDVVVSGFDDLAMAGSYSPALTTIRPPFLLMGQRAVELLLSSIDGELTTSTVELPGELVIRHSCGCLLPTIQEAANIRLFKTEPKLSEQSLAQAIAGNRKVIGNAMAQAVGSNVQAKRWANQVINGFINELDHATPGAFLSALDQVLNQVIVSGGRVKEWQRALSVLREKLAPFLASDDLRSDADNLFHQGRVLVGEISWRHQSWKRLQIEGRSRQLRMMGAGFATTLELKGLFRVLAQELPLLGIPRAYMVLYDTPGETMSEGRLVMGYDSTRAYEDFQGSLVFRTDNLLPEEIWADLGSFSLLVEALCLRDESLGYMIFETNEMDLTRDGEVFDALQLQISGAVKAAMLHQEVQSARHEAEAGWRLAEERRIAAEEANVLKSRFLSMVSHELRTPLNVISGLSENLIQDFPAIFIDLAEEQKVFFRDLQRIHASAQHLDNLIRDVLDLASSQAGQLRLTYEDLDIKETLNPVIEIGERLAMENGLSWNVCIPKSLPLIHWDRTRLRQVVLNLVSNAIKFTDSGDIELSIEVNDPPDKMVMFSVKDTGLGIPQEEQKIIFEEFKRTSRVTARGYGGMGLGLAICRKLVEMGGGEIGVESSGEPGSGSYFYFTLPAKMEPAKNQDDNIRPYVLLLESRIGQSETVMEHLTGKGFEVERQYLDDDDNWSRSLSDSPPGAIVLNLAPGSEAARILSSIKNLPLQADIPVLIYSLSTDHDLGSVMEMNILEKPLSNQRLAHTLEEQGLVNHDENRTILIVDDEANILDLHSHMITTQFPNIRVMRAVNGVDALQCMRKQPPDLVLLDLMMPEMDGFQVLEAMRQMETTRNVPVIILTSQKLSDEMMHDLNQGVTAILEKGLFTIQETLEQLEAALARNKRLGGEARRIARRAMVYIHEHYDEPISRKDLADFTGVSQAYLSMCFDKKLALLPRHTWRGTGLNRQKFY
jgi:signal transduction histidine kinase/DNA-binding LacI/PurR family transcriptional regulator/CheY-like chemotaxis protein